MPHSKKYSKKKKTMGKVFVKSHKRKVPQARKFKRLSIRKRLVGKGPMMKRIALLSHPPAGTSGLQKRHTPRLSASKSRYNK
tara:strand:+ start:1525 stop:1770 length:246 start_codon:yes stop_codon:yes gene_type:complete